MGLVVQRAVQAHSCFEEVGAVRRTWIATPRDLKSQSAADTRLDEHGSSCVGVFLKGILSFICIVFISP